MRSGRILTDYLHDIIDNLDKARKFVEGIDYKSFQANEEKNMAVVRALEIIGEAARHIPKTFVISIPKYLGKKLRVCETD